MKKITFLVLVLCGTLCAHAQTWEEWFRQKETQKKYLLEQIAALKVYLGYAKKGYEIAGKGWGIIQGIKEGDWNLHRDFFSALSSVNPSVKASPFVAGTITLHVRIQDQIKKTQQFIRASEQFTSAEIQYARKVLDGLLLEAHNYIEELALLTTSGHMELSDDERLQRIEGLHQDTLQIYNASSSFSAEAKLLAVQRMRERIQIHHSEERNRLP